jgi:hypothetical protein
MKETKGWKIHGTERDVIRDNRLSRDARLAFVNLRSYLSGKCKEPIRSKRLQRALNASCPLS